MRAVLQQRGIGWLAPLMAFPAVWWTIGEGQNAFPTAALPGLFTLLIDARPVRAGVLLGALCYEPHFGLLAPVALLAGRRWAALAGATGAVAVLVGASVLAFGWLLRQARETGFVAWDKLALLTVYPVSLLTVIAETTRHLPFVARRGLFSSKVQQFGAPARAVTRPRRWRSRHAEQRKTTDAGIPSRSRRCVLNRIRHPRRRNHRGTHSGDDRVQHCPLGCVHLFRHIDQGRVLIRDQRPVDGGSRRH